MKYFDDDYVADEILMDPDAFDEEIVAEEDVHELNFGNEADESRNVDELLSEVDSPEEIWA
ncbi:MAG: hypothetical protein GF398_08815 [Chitinivibrionales bacterium]|nr:hypothetical protein [Chitinivibrionales bacterium]